MSLVKVEIKQICFENDDLKKLVLNMHCLKQTRTGLYNA